MPLTISMRCGDDFYVNDVQLVLREIHSPYQGVVVLEDGRVFTVAGDRSTEVMPGVFVSMGQEDQSNMVRVVIDAPRDQLILTGRNYRRRDMSSLIRHAAIPDSVIKEAVDLGLAEDAESARRLVVGMVKLSAPLSHTLGNRRNGEFGFNVERGLVESIFRIADHPAPEEGYELGDDEVACPDCGGDGGTCATCDGTGGIDRERSEELEAWR